MDIDDFDTEIQSDEAYDVWVNEDYWNECNDVRNPKPEDARDYDPAGDGWGFDDIETMMGE